MDKTSPSLKVKVWKVAASNHIKILFTEDSCGGTGCHGYRLDAAPGLAFRLLMVSITHEAEGLAHSSRPFFVSNLTHRHIQKNNSQVLMHSCLGAIMLMLHFSFSLQDGRVGTPLASPPVADHADLRLVLDETKAALLWARTTQTCKQSSMNKQLTNLQQSHKHCLFVPPFVPFLISCWPTWPNLMTLFLSVWKVCHCSVVPLWYWKALWRM